MIHNCFPNTDIKVSKICLGTMTFGQQNSKAEGHDQMDFAFENGVNFFDTAEMYSIPPSRETYGSTERIVGSWLKKTGNRDDIFLASKIVGPSPAYSYMRENIDFSPKTISLALNQSLERLQTDYIDLYQLHWPERKSNMFGQRGFKVQNDPWEDNIQLILETLQDFIKQGKIKHIGISNETPWGVMRYLEESKYKNLPKIKTIQNPYSLLNRLFETGLSEMCLREDLGLLAYSPLAFGMLSGKYLQGIEPSYRMALFPQYGRYSSENCKKATQLYNEIAKKYDLSLTQMALAFVNQQAFVSSTIIGATSLEQLKENLASIEVILSDEIINEINQVQALIPDPAP